MPTIRKRVGPRGARFEAIFRIKRDGREIRRESQTFTSRAEAKRWCAKFSDRFKSSSANAVVPAPSTEGPALAPLIRWYIDNFRTIAQWGRTKQTTLEFLERHDIGKQDAQKLSTAILVEHIAARRASGVSPSTAANDLIWIGCVLRAAKDSGDFPNIDPAVLEEARTACHKLKLIGQSRRRDIRPTADQLARLTAYFQRRDRRSKIPMTDIMWFAIYSARRVSEICRLRRRDNHPRTQTGLVRDAKHPTRKLGNHHRFKYTPEAWDIVVRQPSKGDLIFPHKPQTISDIFTDACKILGIQNLTFHDLRHEATSRLFERGYTIPQVALFTLHESWDELKRYTQLLKKNLRDLPDPKANLTHLATRRIHDSAITG